MEPNTQSAECSEYLTPFQTTVIYDPNDMFETTIAMLLPRAQAIPAADTISCRFISPDVVLFGKIPAETIHEFTKLGFQRIFIFCGPQADSARDGVVIHVDLATFYEHFNLQGVAAVSIMELVLCATFASYKSAIAGTDATTGGYFLTSLREEPNPCAELIKIVSTPRSFDMIENHIVRGKIMQNYQTSILEKRVEHSIIFTKTRAEIIGNGADDVEYTICAVPGNEITRATSAAEVVFSHPRVTRCMIVVFYHLEHHVIDGGVFVGWRLTLASREVDVLELATSAGMSPAGTTNLITCWAAADSARILPFYCGKNKTDALSSC